MSEPPIKHFLIVYDIGRRHADVRHFDTDYDAAQRAYADLEWEVRDDPNIDAVLLSADSLETVKRTHSSYFGTGKRFERLLPPGLLPTR
jgi:hypothetical protein